MKKIIVALIITAMVSCTNSNNNENKKDGTDTASTTTVTEEPDKPKEDTIIWVGLFAEWKRPSGVINGNYDTTKQIFLTCGLNSPVTVPRDSINLLTTDFCLSDAPHRVLMMIKTKDSIHISGDHLIHIDTNAGLKPVAVFRNGTIEKRVSLEPQAMIRIRKIPQLKDSIFRRVH